MILKLPDSPWIYRALNFCLLLALAWVCAGLFWRVVGPAPLPPVAAPAVAGAAAPTADLSAVQRLFSAGPAAVAAPSSLNYKLRGLISSRGESPSAVVLALGDKPAIAVRLGDEIESGVRLIEVKPDHILVDNHGRQEQIALDAKPAALIGGPASELPLPQNQSQPGETKPGTAVASDEKPLNREALANGMQSLNVADWSRGLANAPEGGIVVENPGAQPLAGLLGLNGGDVLKSVNGAALSKTNDISNLYGAFSRENLVTLTLLRNGQPVTLKYRINNRTHEN